MAGKDPDEGGGFSFPFQDTEVELEPSSHPQSPRTGCGTGGASAALGAQDLSQVGSRGSSVWSFTFPPEFTGNRRFQAVALVGELDFFIIIIFLVAQQSCWSSSSWSGRFWEGSSGGGSKDHPGRVHWEQFWGSSLQGCSSPWFL